MNSSKPRSLFFEINAPATTPMICNKPIILASQSARRAQILREAGIAFEAVLPRFEEPPAESWSGDPALFAEENSYRKAHSVGDDYPEHLVLAADTVVALNGRLYGKPTDEADARRILSTLAGSTHQVITGVTLYCAATTTRITAHAITRITMRPMQPRELDAYIASREWEGKAGAYAIQETADAFVTHVDGSFTNVVGLPIELVRELLSRLEHHER